MRWKTKDEIPGSISLPYGIKTSHTWHEIGQVLRIINDYDIDMFVELGTHVGGLATVLLPISQYRDFTYFGVERDATIIHPGIRDRVFIANILEYMEPIRQLKLNHKSFIYCDGGNKIQEMWSYFQILSSGDIIACHDYFDYQNVIGLSGFGTDDGKCGCKPEVKHKDLDFLFDNAEFDILPDYLLDGTRIMGFIKK